MKAGKSARAMGAWMLTGALLAGPAMAQEEGMTADVAAGVDVASAYVFRGETFSDDVSVQPTLEGTFGCPLGGALTLGTWANLNTDSTQFDEVDLYVSYALPLGDIPFDALAGQKERGQVGLRPAVSGLRRPSEPPCGFAEVLSNPAAHDVVPSQGALRGGVSLLGGLPQPVQRILLACAGGLGRAHPSRQLELGIRIVSPCRRPHFPEIRLGPTGGSGVQAQLHVLPGQVIRQPYQGHELPAALRHNHLPIGQSSALAVNAIRTQGGRRGFRMRWRPRVASSVPQQDGPKRQ